MVELPSRGAEWTGHLEEMPCLQAVQCPPGFQQVPSVLGLGDAEVGESFLLPEVTPGSLVGSPSGLWWCACFSLLSGVSAHVFTSLPEECHTIKRRERKEETGEEEGIGRAEEGKEEKKGERERKERATSPL